MNWYEVIIEMFNPCGGDMHSNVRIIELEIADPMDFVMSDSSGGEMTKTVSDDGTVVIEAASAGYIKRYTFSKA